MNDAAQLTIALAVMAFAAASGRLHHKPLSAAMAFVAVGFVLGTDGLGWLDSVTASSLTAVTNITLVLVLFSDASQLDVGLLRREWSVPARLLGIGLPLTIAAGLIAGVVLLPGIAVAEALVLAVILAPTDAALGAAVVTDERLPSRLRQGLNAESGLNDGICVPLLAVALAVADVEAGAEAEPVLTALVKEVGWGLVAGVAAGLLATLVLRVAGRGGGISPVWRPLVTVAGAAIAYTLAIEIHGSGFIAAFVGGLTFRLAYGDDALEEVELLEVGSSLLAAVTFLLFGGVILGPMLHDLSWRVVLYALASLTVVRMIPVALSLIGSRLGKASVLLLGWFGPRGLASIVFGLIVVDSADLPHTHLLMQVVTITIAISVLLHGITAVPLVDRFVARHPTPSSPDVAAAGERSG